MLVNQKQTVWKLPAFLNLTLGGMGAGYYLLTFLAVFPESGSGSGAFAQIALIKLLGPMLVSIGLLSLTAEAGHPLNSIFLLKNLRHSWMSREALAAGVFILVAFLDWLLPHPVLHGLAALSGLFFMFAQGMMVWRASGVYTWSVAIVPWFFLSCGLVTGGGLMLFVCAFCSWVSVTSFHLVLFIIALINASTWVIYLRTPGDLFKRATAPIRQASHLFMTLGIGHLLPMLLIVFSMAFHLSILDPLIGLMLVLGGVIQKFGFALLSSAMRSVI